MMFARLIRFLVFSGMYLRESIQTPQIEILTESWSMYLALVP